MTAGAAPASADRSESAPFAPLGFRFRVAPPHDTFRVQDLRISARVRVALIAAGIETLRELEGLTGADLAALRGLEPAAAVSVVASVRWRCCRRLPSWPLIGGADMSVVPALADHAAALRAAGCHTLDDLVGADPQFVTSRGEARAPGLERTLDRYARLASVRPEGLRAATACPSPFVLPRVDPLVLLGVLCGTDASEKLAALTLGRETRDSVLVLLYWGLDASRPWSCERLGLRFGLPAARVRHMVIRHERELASSLLRVSLSPEQLADSRHAGSIAVLRRLRLLARAEG
jgi:hypothetical protein